MRWTKKAIIESVQELHRTGADLSCARAQAQRINLVRAATWHFGSWRHALEAAGLDAEALSRYQKWSRERIVARILELHARGEDLSWRSVSTRLDPPLAAAALRPNGFQSWREAIAAAGLDIEAIAKYEHWNSTRVVEEIQGRAKSGEPLSSKLAQQEDPGLFTAARRRFGSWDQALEAAGLDVNAIRLRKSRPQN